MNREIMTWAETKSQLLNQLSHQGTPIFIIYFEREREKQGRGREREEERENPKQALHCQSRAQWGAWSQELWDHDLNLDEELDA